METRLPIYEYQCERCAAVTDIKHGFKETMNEACPKCGGTLKRLFKPASIVFKGSGFYVNDSRKPAAAASDKSEPSKSEPSKSEPSKSEPSKSEPSKSEPSKSEPAKSDTGGKSGKSDAAA